MKSDTQTIISALRVLAQDIQSGDGVANAVIAEAADRLEELQTQLKESQDYADRLAAHKDMVCLPADLANLREANTHFATENWKLKEKLRLIQEAAAHAEYVANTQPQ